MGTLPASKHAPSGTVPHRPLSLNETGTPGEGPSATAQDDGQLALSPSFHWHEKGSRLRALLNRAIELNRMTHAMLSEQTGIDEKQIGRALKDDGGAHPPLALVACVLWHDKRGAFLTSLAESLGYEATPRKPDLAAENKRLRSALAAAIQALQEAQP